ncbi:hypothetical protein ACFQ68_40115 [Amycolatopsis japonica]|uniref:hypothetical protein n=1 Tax=Amycolatopsis japonica TaxID=208439 RepID=UPI00366C3BD3
MNDTSNAYPVPRPNPRAQAPALLVEDVFAALTAHGFPDDGSVADRNRLRATLTAFLYADLDQPADPTRTVTRTADGGISVTMRTGDVEAGSSIVGLRIDGSL